MESYEQFFLQNMAVQEEKRSKKRLYEPCCSLKALSAIRFHGKAVLSPLLSPEQRSEMCDYRQRAVRLEQHRQRQRRNSLVAHVQQLLDQAQLHRLPGEQDDKWPTPPRCLSPKLETVSGYTLVTDTPGLPRDPGFGPPTSHPPTEHPQREPPSIVNGYNMEEEAAKEESQGRSEEHLSLDSLLKRSREFVEREQSRRNSRVIHKVSRTPPPDSLSDKENDSGGSPGGAGVQFRFSLRHSPVGPPQPWPQTQPSGPGDPQSLFPACPFPGASGPSPEPSLSPCMHRRRPRPVSTGNIHISFPVGPADLIPRSPGRSGEAAARGEALSSSSARSPDPSGGTGGGSSSRRSSHCGTSPVQELRNPVTASGASPAGQHDHTASPGFRRRCHTLDSQVYLSAAAGDHIDRSQERVPRFMAGVTRLAPSRWTPPLNHSYDVENPSPCLYRPHVPAELPQAKHRTTEAVGPQGAGNSDRTGLRDDTEQQNSKATEETQRRVQALEHLQKRLEEEHALQISLLLSEHEKEQQRLRQDLEETEGILKQQGGEDLDGRDCRLVRDSCPAPTPCCPGLSPAHTPAERSPGHSIGVPSPLSSSVSAPAVQPPIYLCGSSWGANKTRARLSQFLSVEQQRALCRLGSITRGFLTRRLLRTEKVKHLRQTVADTQEFIRSFKTDSPQTRGAVSAQDLSLQERVRAQLRAALYDVHDIFFEMPLEERLALLQQDRELRAERRLREMEKAKSPKERVVLSAATQRSLDRKKRVGESPAQARKMQPKPKSPTTNRMLKPNPGHSSPIPGQLNRQGSWYRKTPEERVRRSDSLKKQHSLG